MRTVSDNIEIECPECGHTLEDVEVELTFWSDRHGFSYGPAEEGMEFEIQTATVCPECGHDCEGQVENWISNVSQYDYMD